MSAQHEVAALRQTEELLIGILGNLPAEVGDADDEVALLLLAEDIDILLGRFSRVDVGDALAVAVEDQSLQGRSQREESDLHAIALQGDIGLHKILQHRIIAVVI